MEKEEAFDTNDQRKTIIEAINDLSYASLAAGTSGSWREAGQVIAKPITRNKVELNGILYVYFCLFRRLGQKPLLLGAVTPDVIQYRIKVS